jgi:hypothetical protein
MSKSNDESKQPTGLDRRAVMRGALAVGGASILATAAAGASTAPTPTPALQVVAEQEWARVLSRVIVNQLPQAVAQVPDIRLTTTQVAELQRAFENTLITNMGCTVTG